ncbi:MAG: hypothetical protein Q4B26_20085, partial [Eubacteriales bacterium]|nr:hypothetical protein [Eubacteriales bacterium]
MMKLSRGKRMLALFLSLIMVLTLVQSSVLTAFAEETEYVEMVREAEPAPEPVVQVEETPVEPVIEQPIEQPVEQPVELPAEQPAEQPAEISEPEQVEVPVEQPTEVPAEQPTAQETGNESEPSQEEPAADVTPAEEPADAIEETPAEEVAEEPEVTYSNELANYVTRVILRNESNVEIGSVSDAEAGSQVQAEIRYTIPGGAYEQHKTYTYQLSGGFPVNAFTEEPIRWGENVVGRYTVETNGRVTVYYQDGLVDKNGEIQDVIVVTGRLESGEINGAPVDLSPYIDSLVLYRNGEPITSGTTVTHGDNIKVSMHYTIPGSIFGTTRIYTYQIPANVKVSAQSGRITQGSQTVGTYTVSADGLVTFT